MEIKIGHRYYDKREHDEQHELYFEVCSIDIDGRAFGVSKLFDGSIVEENWSFRTLKIGYLPYQIKVKATRLAKKMYPKAEEEDGYLIVEA